MAPTTTRMDTLIEHSYSVQRFADLPTHYQLAIVWYMAVDGEAWDAVDLSHCANDSDTKSALTEFLPKYVDAYGETLFGSVCLSATALKGAIMEDPEISEGFSCWDEYHLWYLSGGAIPSHPRRARWPVILSRDDSETLRDGWHRAHSYIRDGDTNISAVFYPSDYHLPAS